MDNMRFGSGDQMTVAAEYSNDFATFLTLTAGHQDLKTKLNDSKEDFITNQSLIREGNNLTANLSETSITFNTATLSGMRESDQTTVIVGVLCGIVGLVLGIAISAAIWIYKQKRRNSNAPGSRRTSGFEKNPAEKTFEPLDLSLTLPSYGNETSNLDTRLSSSEVIASNSTPKLHLNSCTPREGNDISYQAFEPQSTLLSNHNLCQHDYSLLIYGTENQLSEITNDRKFMSARFGRNKDEGMNNSRKKSVTDSSFGCNHERKDDSEILKPPASIATRDSFSSGHGTGTESEIFPSDCRKYNSFPHIRRAPTNLDQSNQRTNSKSNLCLIRDLNASSMSASSSTASINEWLSTDTSNSPETVSKTIDISVSSVVPQVNRIVNGKNMELACGQESASNERLSAEASKGKIVVWVDENKKDKTARSKNESSSYFEMDFVTSTITSKSNHQK